MWIKFYIIAIMEKYSWCGHRYSSKWYQKKKFLLKSYITRPSRTHILLHDSQNFVRNTKILQELHVTTDLALCAPLKLQRKYFKKKQAMIPLLSIYSFLYSLTKKKWGLQHAMTEDNLSTVGGLILINLAK